MLLHVVHATSYQYAPHVENAHHVACLKPSHQPGQNLLRHSLHINPTPAQQREVADVYGNSRSFFSLQASHSQLHVTAHSVVHTFSTAPHSGEAQNSL